LGEQVFEKDGARELGELGFFEEGAGRENGGDAAFRNGMRHCFFARGEIEIDGCFAGKSYAEIRERAAG
jgi:hypothetical protein